MADRDDVQDYWLNATETFVADDGYYASVASALRDCVLPLVGPDARMLDIGCGDGSFTALLAAAAEHVDAFDLAPGLIAQAEARRLRNVTFRVGTANESWRGPYDLVSCMGVLVCIADDEDFGAALDAAARAVRPGGLLLLRETVSGWGRRVSHKGGYAACYRTRAAYVDRLPDFELAVDLRLATWSRLARRTNSLWLFRRRIESA